MNNTDIKNALSKIQEMEFYLEEEYMENGGEVTDSTEQKEQAIAAVKELLNTEGVDSLGRWLASVQDKITRLKAEKDAVTRQINAANSTIDYIKYMVNEVLTKTGEAKVKGTFYSFAPTTSVKTEVEKSVLKEMYQEKVESILRDNDIIPADVTISLGASVSALPEGSELPAYYTRTETPSCKFTKPRASKKSEE